MSKIDNALGKVLGELTDTAAIFLTPIGKKGKTYGKIRDENINEMGVTKFIQNITKTALTSSREMKEKVEELRIIQGDDCILIYFLETGNHAVSILLAKESNLGLAAVVLKKSLKTIQDQLEE